MNDYSKERTLETMLESVKNKKTHQQRIKDRFVGGCIALLFVGVFYVIKGVSSLSSPDLQVPGSTTHNTTVSPTKDGSQLSQINLAKHGEVKTMTISCKDLAQIIYDPNFTFSVENGALMWRSESSIVYMPMPKTLLAITDTSLFTLTDIDNDDIVDSL